MRSSEPLSVVAQRAWSASARSSEAGGTKACSSVSGSPSRNWPRATQDRSRDCTGQTCSSPSTSRTNASRASSAGTGRGGTLITPASAVRCSATSRSARATAPVGLLA